LCTPVFAKAAQAGGVISFRFLSSSATRRMMWSAGTSYTVVIYYLTVDNEITVLTYRTGGFLYVSTGGGIDGERIRMRKRGNIFLKKKSA
jgi:hypothetical protein